MNMRGGESSTVPLLSALLLFTNGCLSIACNDTHYGAGCSQLCPCTTTNTAYCDDTFGTCSCLPNWTGENCTVDVDECITNSNSCNFTTQECINNVGGFSCVCLYGNSSTGCIEKVPAYVPDPAELKIGIVLTFANDIPLSDYNNVRQTMKVSLTRFYNRRIFGFIRVIILVIRRGSTIVEHEVIMNKTEEANQDLVESVFSLSGGESKINYKNEILTTSSVAVGDASGKQQVITTSSSKCDIYVINNPCGENKKCVEDNTTPYCKQIVDSSDNFQLIVGLGVGISLFVLAVLIGTITVYFVRGKPNPVVLSNNDYIENTYSEGDMYIVMGRLTKVDSLDRYGSEFSHWSGQRGERGRGDFDDVSRTRESCSTHDYNTIE